MQLSLAVNTSGLIYCVSCRAPIFENRKYVITGREVHHITCFKKNVEKFLSLLKENGDET